MDVVEAAHTAAPVAGGVQLDDQCWTMLPAPCWRLLMTHLYSKHSLFNCSVTCRSFANVADELAVELRRVPAADLPRALRRFDRAVRVSVEAPPPSAAPGGGGERGAPAKFRQLVRGLVDAPPVISARVEALRISGYEEAPTALAAALLGTGGPEGAGQEEPPFVGTHAGLEAPAAAPQLHPLLAGSGAGGEGSGGTAGGSGGGPRPWLALTSLAFDLFGDLDWLNLASAIDALPALNSLTLSSFPGINQRMAWLAPPAAAFSRLTSLELSDMGFNAGMALPEQLPTMPGLRRLAIRGCAGLQEVPLQRLPGLEELEVADAAELLLLPGLSSLTSLTSLTIHNCPLAVRAPSTPPANPAALFPGAAGPLAAFAAAIVQEELAAVQVVGGPPPVPLAALAHLPQLESLRLTGSNTLHRLPSGVSALTSLTNLEVTPTLRDRGPEGNEPEDYAPLGRGGPPETDAGLLRARGLRRLAVRGFGGPLHLPEGMERFTALQELDLGGRQELWNLGPWLLRLRSLRRVVVPRRSAQQSVFEALSLRNDPHQVEVEEEDDGWGAGSEDGGGNWGEDGEGWAEEGF